MRWANRKERSGRASPAHNQGRTDAAPCIKEDAIVFILDRVSASSASRQQGISHTGLPQTILRLLAGQDPSQASDAPAALGLRLKLGSAIRIAKQGKRNANESLSYLQAADEALEEVIRLLARAADLAEQGRTSALSNVNRIYIDAEFQNIIATLHEIVAKTRFNGAAVFTTTPSPVSADGLPTIGLAVSSLSSSADFALGLSATRHALTATPSADAAGPAIATAIASASSLRASLAASMEQLTSASNLLGIQVENCSAVCSQVRETNITEEVVNLTKFQILNQSGTSPLNQTHQASQLILALLR